MTPQRIEQTARAAIEHVFPGAIAVGKLEQSAAYPERLHFSFNHIRADFLYFQGFPRRHRWVARIYIIIDGKQESYACKQGYARSALRTAYAEAYGDLSYDVVEAEKRLGRLRTVLECLPSLKENQESS